MIIQVEMDPHEVAELEERVRLASDLESVTAKVQGDVQPNLQPDLNF